MKKIIYWLLRTPLHFFLILYSVIVIYPMVWLLSTSLKTSHGIYASTWSLPTVPQWNNFARAWIEANMGRYFLNSIFITSVSVSLILLISALAAYVLARFRFFGNSFIFNMFLSGMMFPIYLGLVPLFFLLRSLKILDTYWGLISVYIAYSLPFTIFVLVPFFKTLPHELAEAALIDGCSQFGIFWRVMLPLAKPGLVTAGIFNFLGIWNEYILALVIISSDHLRTLPLGIANLMMVEHYKCDWGALFAGLVIVMMPTLLVYAIFQKQIAKGVTMGALKG